MSTTETTATTNGTPASGSSEKLVVEISLHTQRGSKGTKILAQGEQPADVGPRGKVPRVSKLMALALSIESRVRSGELESYAHVAVLGHVTRARVSQIVNLVNLAPDIIEQLLFLPRTETGRDRILLRDLQPIAQTLDWKQQRRLWREFLAARGLAG